MHSYQLRTAYVARQKLVEISAERHAELVRARKCLIDAGNFERRYALLVGNFLAIEEFTAVVYLREEVVFDIGYEGGDAVLLEANRHVINFFTSAKSYVDQVNSDFKLIGGEGWFHKRAEKELNEAFDRSIHYRISDQLRGRAQHRAMPVEGYDAGPDPKGMAGVWFYATKKTLAADGKFKKKTLEEAPDKIYFRKTLRGYMHEISAVHIALRKLIWGDVGACRAAIEAAIEGYRLAQGERGVVSPTGIGVESAHYENERLVDAIPLLLNWDDNRLKLAERHGSTISLSF